MEELIEYIEEWTPKNKTTDGIWSKAKNLLVKEKQQLISFGYSQIQYIDAEIGDLIYNKNPEEIYRETFGG